jgi:hypothetical protein
MNNTTITSGKPRECDNSSFLTSPLINLSFVNLIILNFDQVKRKTATTIALLHLFSTSSSLTTTTTSTMKLSSTSSLLLLFSSLFVGAAAGSGGTSSSYMHLRGGHRDDLSSSSQDIDDIVTLSSFLMIEVVDVPMDDLSFEDRADFNYAFQQAFDTIHGDHDGLYLSGEQIDGINNVTAEDISSSSSSLSSSSSNIITARRRKPRWPKPKKSKYYNNFDIYLHVDMSGRCRLCKDDDYAMMEDEDETDTSLLQLLLRNTNNNNYSANSNVQQLEQQDSYSSSRLSSSSEKEEQDTSEYVFDESNLDAVADEFCRLLKDSSGNKRFSNAKMCDIFILSETDYNTALTTIAANPTSASAATADDNDAPEEEDTIPADSESDSSAVSLPYFYGNKETSNNIKADAEIIGTGYLKITLNGIGMHRNRSLNPLPCGVWHNDDVFDFGSSIHNAFNAIHGTTTDGIFDAGQTIDKIKCVREAEEEDHEEHEAAAVDIDNDADTTEDASDSATVVGALGYNRKSRWPKTHHNKWGDHFDIYLGIVMMVEDASSSFSDANEVAAAYFSEASLRDIADAASDDLIRFGNPHFRHLIDCTIEYLTPSEYYTQALYNDEDHEEATTTSHAADTSAIIAADA